VTPLHFHLPSRPRVWLTFFQFIFGSYLSDPSHREIYESAHSVILSVFATQTGRDETGFLDQVDSPVRNATINGNLKSPSDSVNFVQRIVPFYAHCLIDVSVFRPFQTHPCRLFECRSNTFFLNAVIIVSLSTLANSTVFSRIRERIC
jgi:hypothetical protein